MWDKDSKLYLWKEKTIMKVEGNSQSNCSCDSGKDNPHCLGASWKGDNWSIIVVKGQAEGKRSRARSDEMMLHSLASRHGRMPELVMIDSLQDR